MRKNINEEISKLKRVESLEIKKMRESSLNKIKEYRKGLADCKKQQYLKIKSSENLMKKNINDFWNKKKRHYFEIHHNLKNENEKFSFMKEKEIIELEKKEENLIKRLEKSQKIDDNILEKMEEIAFTPVEEFIQKYGEKEKEIKKQNKSKSLHIALQ